MYMINWNLIFSYLTTPLETLSCILSPLVIAINLPWPIIANFKLSVSRISLCWHYQPSFHLTYSLYFCLNSTICQTHQDSKLEEKKLRLIRTSALIASFHTTSFYYIQSLPHRIQGYFVLSLFYLNFQLLSPIQSIVLFPIWLKN